MNNKRTTTSFAQCVREQVLKHPAIRPGDMVKYCYQAAFGVEHLLNDPEKAYCFLKKEWEEVRAEEISLLEPLNEYYARVNIAAWKYHRIPFEALLRLFLCSASVKIDDARLLFDEYLDTVERLSQEGVFGFDDGEWVQYRKKYESSGITPVHHSNEYRENEHPAYRVISLEYADVIEILRNCGKAVEAGPLVIAVDGHAASGKTTLSHKLEEVLEADTVHMDDFFLPPEMRSPERFNIPGGNVHSERFIREVLPFINRSEAFSYRVFDCSIMDYKGEKEIKSPNYRIVEGSYSHHPDFGCYADIKVFCDIDAKEQERRIRIRNGEMMWERFKGEWIPMEKDYFKAFDIRKKADIIIGSDREKEQAWNTL